MKKSIRTGTDTVLSPGPKDNADGRNILRPRSISEYIGQEKIKKKIILAMEAAKNRDEPVGHVLLYGPPGLGKTSLAGVIAEYMDADLSVTSGNAFEKTGELVKKLTSLSEGDVLFIDEIHGLDRQVQDVLYPAMEDFAVDITFGSGEQTKTVRLPIPRVTIIGATTRADLLNNALKDRFENTFRMEYYTPEELSVIIKHSAARIGCPEMTDGARLLIAQSSRGTPRLANRFVKTARDYAQVNGLDIIKEEEAQMILAFCGIWKDGLDETDRKYLGYLAEVPDCPAGLDTIASVMGENSRTVEEVIEPFLIYSGYIVKTPRGRKITERGLSLFTGTEWDGQNTEEDRRTADAPPGI